MPTTTPFANLITFSRGTNATVVGPDGLIQWAPSNLLTNSEQFDASAWTKANATIYANQDIGNGTLGSELVTNGDFSNGSTGWITASWVVSGGVATITNVIDSIAQNVSFTAGRLYRVTYTVTAFSGTGGVRPRFFGGTTVTGTTVSAPGTYTEYLYAVTGNTQVAIASTSNTCTVSIDNISVKEITPAAAVAPDGTYTADTLVDDGNSSRHGINQNPTIVASATYTTSLYVKAGTGRYFTLSVSRAAAGSVYYAARYDLQTATVTATGVGGGGTHTASSITAVGNGWYRCVLTGVLSTFTDAVVQASGATSSTGFGDRGAEFYVGSGSTWLIWGAQVEVGSTATTYNPTTVKNLFGFSEAFDNAAWAKTGASIVTGAQANPVNGLFNAQKLMENTANAQHRVTNSVTLAAVPHTFSAYLKAGERTWALMVNGAIANGFAYFNLSTGVVGSVGAGTTAVSITAAGSGWYRCAITFTASAGSNSFEIRTASADGISIYTGDGNSGIYIYGAQLSDSASLDPYVPTPGAAPSSTAYYGPRFDYDPVTRLPRGILIEEQRTNLLLRSEEFDNASWSKTNITVTANTDVSPDGTTNADTLLGTAPGSANTCTQSITAAALVYTFSVWVKAGTATTAAFLFRDSTAAANLAATGQILSGPGSVSGTTAITVSGLSTTQWTRVAVTLNAAATAGNTLILLMYPETSTSANTTGKSNIFYGAQLEAGAFATSYIPTIASTVTRSADVALIGGALFSQWYNFTQGTLVVETATAGDIVSSYSAVASNAAGTNIVGTDVDSSGFYRLRVTESSVNQALVSAVGPITANTTYKLAGAYRTNDFAASANGGAVGADTSGTVPADVTTFSIGSLGLAGAVSWNGYIRSITYIPVRAADFQVQALTT